MNGRHKPGTPIVMQFARRKKHLGLLVGAAAQNASSFSRASSDAMTGASVGSALAPGIGTAIGAVVGIIGSLFGPAKEGQAAQTWDDMVKNGYLFTTVGTAFDERYIGEAYKGAMDEGNNIWPGCGKDGYKNPDCFYSQLARAIAAGYLAKKVPLNASASTVYTTVVVPWLASGAGGLFNWQAAVAEQQQQGIPLSQQELLIQAATDRYINGLPITRANMPSYEASWSTYAQWSTPPLATLISSILPALQPVTTPAGYQGNLPQTDAPVSTAQTSPVLPTGANTGLVASGSGVIVSQGIPTWVWIGGAALVLYFVLRK